MQAYFNCKIATLKSSNKLGNMNSCSNMQDSDTKRKTENTLVSKLFFFEVMNDSKCSIAAK